MSVAKMKVLVILAIVAVATARRYNPDEEDEFRVKSFVWQDENGEFLVEDLSTPIPVPRATANDVTMYLYTKDTIQNPEIIRPADFQTMVNAITFNKMKKNVFIFHGWFNTYKSNVNKVLTDAVLSTHDVNVFVVDWSKKSIRDYFTSAWSVPTLGDAIGTFVNDMMYHYNISSKSFNFLGHSLGAHIAGRAGSKTNGKINYIIGMDPAGPLFSVKNTETRLDPTDADFVEVIHTSGLKLSFDSSLGHADFFPNGGSFQPGCGLDLFGMCAHGRSYHYVAESIKLSDFTAVLCPSYSKYNRGDCESSEESYLGGFRVDKRAGGDYYLKTNKQAPFALE